MVIGNTKISLTTANNVIGKNYSSDFKYKRSAYIQKSKSSVNCIHKHVYVMYNGYSYIEQIKKLSNKKSWNVCHCFS